MDRPDIEGLSKGVAEYIAWLEDGRNGASDLILELNLTAKVFAEDLRKIRMDDGVNATYIGKSDKTKKFEHAITLFDKIDKVKALASYFKQEEKERQSGNVFEDMSKKIQSKINGSK